MDLFTTLLTAAQFDDLDHYLIIGTFVLVFIMVLVWGAGRFRS